MLSVASGILPASAIMVIAAVTLAAIYGLAALWAVAGRVGWLWRVAPVSLLLAALAPVGAYELVVVYGAQAAVIIAWVWLARILGVARAGRQRGQRWRASLVTALRHSWGDGLRFRLRGLLQAVLLAAAVLAIVRYAAPVLATPGASISWTAWMLVGIGVGLATVAAEWSVFGHAAWYLRLPVVLIVCAAFGGLLQIVGVNSLLAATFGFALAGLMSLARLTGWAWWRRESIGQDATAASTAPAQSWWRLPSRAVLCLAAVASLTIVTPMYRILLPPTMATVELPDPNGYDGLLQAAKAINWSAIPTQDYEAAGIDTCRKFTHDNSMAFTLVREALSRPSRVPISYSLTFVASNLPDIQAMREIHRALAAHARLAELEGRHADAVKICVEMLRLGHATASGGLLIHERVGIAVAGGGLHGMAPELSQLDAASLVSVRQSLEELAAAREPTERYFEREILFARLSHGWATRLWLSLDESVLLPARKAVHAAGQRFDAQLRLVLTEAAVRRHVLLEGSPPESLAALVPKYLSKVPQDPYRDGPLVYRRTADGYLLYSVGNNGTDDGGQRTTLVEAAHEGKGDLFFDASQETPDENEESEVKADDDAGVDKPGE